MTNDAPEPILVDRRRLVLASTSRYRSELMASLDVEFITTAPLFDERSLDEVFERTEPGEFALLLARGKAASVAADHPDSLIIAGDQIAVLGESPAVLLHQPGNEARAVEQLMAMAGTTHQLINGIVVVDTSKPEGSPGREFTEIDRHRITMRPYTRAEAVDYVRRFEPFDCAGGYRIEDDADLIASVEGEHRSGIIGLPLPTVARLLRRAGREVRVPK